MQINIEKRYAVLIVVGAFVLAGAIFAYALSPGQAPANGYTINQIAPPVNCGNGQVLTWNGNSNSWECSSVSSSTQSQKKYITVSYTVCDNKYSGLSSCPANYPNQIYKSPEFFVSFDDCGHGRYGAVITCSN